MTVWIDVSESHDGWRVRVRRGLSTRQFRCATRAGALWKAWRLSR